MSCLYSRPLTILALFSLLCTTALSGCGGADETEERADTAPAETEEPSAGSDSGLQPEAGSSETATEAAESAEDQEEGSAPSPQLEAWLAGLDDGLRDMSNPQQGVSLSEARRHYEVVCSSCHGRRGAGDGAIAGELDPPATDLTDPLRWDLLTDGQRYSAIQDGIPGTTMGPFGAAMSAEQIWNLVTLINGFVDDSRRPPAAEEPAEEVGNAP